MKFELLPVIDIMLELYRQPLTQKRFEKYLRLLGGDTRGDLSLPIGGFNPMAKEHVTGKLLELKQLHAESLIQETLSDLNAKIATKRPALFRLALNLADDVKGGWTNRYTTDYSSRFKINALVNRHFCTPLFWAGETYSTLMIRQRTLEYAWRTIYWTDHPKPVSLKDHITQEAFVAQQVPQAGPAVTIDFNVMGKLYQEYLDTTDYSFIFNFLYGDTASKQLAFPTFGIPGEMPGFIYARQLASE